MAAVVGLGGGFGEADAELIGIVNKRLQKAGVLSGRSTSSRANDAEQKFAALMLRDGIKKADLHINNPEGPCKQRLGCDDVLSIILGNKRQLTAHWPDGNGGWESQPYGGAP
ncbi:hypothetical protein OG819_02165 [Streptomyces sp. NBC_01549]|uniref:DddA-like double-stranded DNA deaminase toxin n=1 Tax=Streptomyces sp. NBC_01549 TaxID=2975874 RepID=UPI002253741B|nr:DddA-like double-stranded DNA deaminase toxin [Streptomyces sp. NBC_01549]MCX4588588.1 hypothetical protein [Streptomyces sp. NBC_01549]